MTKLIKTLSNKFNHVKPYNKSPGYITIAEGKARALVMIKDGNVTVSGSDDTLITKVARSIPGATAILY